MQGERTYSSSARGLDCVSRKTNGRCQRWIRLRVSRQVAPLCSSLSGMLRHVASFEDAFLQSSRLLPYLVSCKIWISIGPEEFSEFCPTIEFQCPSKSINWTGWCRIPMVARWWQWERSGFSAIGELFWPSNIPGGDMDNRHTPWIDKLQCLLWKSKGWERAYNFAGGLGLLCPCKKKLVTICCNVTSQTG